MTKSRIFPVEESISCSILWLNIKSQKAFEIELSAESVCQLISAKLKSPTTMTLYLVRMFSK